MKDDFFVRGLSHDHNKNNLECGTRGVASVSASARYKF